MLTNHLINKNCTASNLTGKFCVFFFLSLQYESYTSINHVCLLHLQRGDFICLLRNCICGHLHLHLFFVSSSFPSHSIFLCCNTSFLLMSQRAIQGFMLLTSIRDNVSVHLYSHRAKIISAGYILCKLSSNHLKTRSCIN